MLGFLSTIPVLYQVVTRCMEVTTVERSGRPGKDFCFDCSSKTTEVYGFCQHIHNLGGGRSEGQLGHKLLSEISDPACLLLCTSPVGGKRLNLVFPWKMPGTDQHVL